MGLGLMAEKIKIENFCLHFAITTYILSKLDKQVGRKLLFL